MQSYTMAHINSYKFGIYCRANVNMMKCACLFCKINVHLLLKFWAGKWDSETGCVVVVVCHCDGTKVSVPLTGPGVCHGEDPGYNRVFSIDFRDHNINIVGIFRSLLTHELLTVPQNKQRQPVSNLTMALGIQLVVVFPDPEKTGSIPTRSTLG